MRFSDMDLYRLMLDRLDQLTEKYLIRDNRPKYTPRLVTKKPEYRKRMLGSCKKCPERIQAECRDRIRHRPNMPVMCERLDELDVLASGLDENVKDVLADAAIKMLERRSPATGRFEKGTTPWNSGMSSFDPSPDTHFKPGNCPQNTVAVGTEVETKGYIRRKVSEPNVWRQRSHIIWEDYHKRSLPEGWIVRHKDGNPLNDDPHNLEAMPRSQNLTETLKDPVILKRRKDQLTLAMRERWKKHREAQGGQHES